MKMHSFEIRGSVMAAINLEPCVKEFPVKLDHRVPYGHPSSLNSHVLYELQSAMAIIVITNYSWL